MSNLVDRFFEGGDPGGQVNEFACLRRPRESTGLEATLEAETRSHESCKLRGIHIAPGVEPLHGASVARKCDRACALGRISCALLAMRRVALIARPNAPLHLTGRMTR